MLTKQAAPAIIAPIKSVATRQTLECQMQCKDRPFADSSSNRFKENRSETHGSQASPLTLKPPKLCMPCTHVQEVGRASAEDAEKVLAAARASKMKHHREGQPPVGGSGYPPTQVLFLSSLDCYRIGKCLVQGRATQTEQPTRNFAGHSPIGPISCDRMISQRLAGVADTPNARSLHGSLSRLKKLEPKPLRLIMSRLYIQTIKS